MHLNNHSKSSDGGEQELLFANRQSESKLNAEYLGFKDFQQTHDCNDVAR